jgi:hypothetical protein
MTTQFFPSSCYRDADSRRLGRRGARSYPHPHRQRQEPRQGPWAHMGRPPSLDTPEQQKEATRRRAQGAMLQELADSYDRSVATMRRATRAA